MVQETDKKGANNTPQCTFMHWFSLHPEFFFKRHQVAFFCYLHQNLQSQLIIFVQRTQLLEHRSHDTINLIASMFRWFPLEPAKYCTHDFYKIYLSPASPSQNRKGINLSRIAPLSNTLTICTSACKMMSLQCYLVRLLEHKNPHLYNYFILDNIIH